MISSIVYSLYPGRLYLNITNKCSNNCVFCVRNYTDELGGYFLWLKEEPPAEKIIDSIYEEIHNDHHTEPEEIIFCGYGEPMYRPDTILNVLQQVKNLYPHSKLRLNTNGQGLLINNGKSFIKEFRGLLDAVSISLNAHNSEIYQKICRSAFGEKSFNSILEFTRETVEYIPEVTLTVVKKESFYSSGGYIIDIDKCKEIAYHLGTYFRIR